MRVALVNDKTSIVDHVHMAGADHEADGYRVVPSETANRGDRYVDGAFVAPVAAVVPASPEVLMAHLRRQRTELLRRAREFQVVAPPHSAPVAVLCDGTDATMVDLGILWRRGIVDGSASVTWDDAVGGSTVLTGLQCVELEGLVAAWRDAVRVVFVAAARDIAARRLITLAAVDALSWPTAA